MTWLLAAGATLTAPLGIGVINLPLSSCLWVDVCPGAISKSCLKKVSNRWFSPTNEPIEFPIVVWVTIATIGTFERLVAKTRLASEVWFSPCTSDSVNSIVPDRRTAQFTVDLSTTSTTVVCAAQDRQGRKSNRHRIAATAAEVTMRLRTVI